MIYGYQITLEDMLQNMSSSNGKSRKLEVEMVYG